MKIGSRQILRLQTNNHARSLLSPNAIRPQATLHQPNLFLSNKPSGLKRFLALFGGTTNVKVVNEAEMTPSPIAPTSSGATGQKIKMVLIGRRTNDRGEFIDPFKQVPGLTPKAHDEGLLGGWSGDFPDLCSGNFRALMETPPNGITPYIVAGFEGNELVLCTFAYQVKIQDTQYTPAELEKLQVFTRGFLERTGISKITDFGDKYLATLNKTMFFGSPWGDMHTLPMKKGDGDQREEARKDAFLDFVAHELVPHRKLDRAICFNWSHDPFHSVPFENFRGSLQKHPDFVDVAGNNTSNAKIGPVVHPDKKRPDLGILFIPADFYYQTSFDRRNHPVTQDILVDSRDLYEAYEIAKLDWFYWARDTILDRLGKDKAPNFKDLAYPNQEDWAFLIDGHPALATEIFLKFPALKYFSSWGPALAAKYPDHFAGKSWIHHTAGWEPAWSDRISDNCDRFVKNGLLINGYADIRARIVFDEMIAAAQKFEYEAQRWEVEVSELKRRIIEACAPPDLHPDLPNRSAIILESQNIRNGQTPDCLNGLSADEMAQAQALAAKVAETLDRAIGPSGSPIVKALKAQDKIDDMLAIVPDDKRKTIFETILDNGRLRAAIESEYKTLLRNTEGVKIVRPGAKPLEVAITPKMIEEMIKIASALCLGTDASDLSDPLKKAYNSTFKLIPADILVQIENNLVPEFRRLTQDFESLCKTYPDKRPTDDPKKAKTERFLDGPALIQQKRQLDEHSANFPDWWKSASEDERAHLRSLMQLNETVLRRNSEIAQNRATRIKEELAKIKELEKKISTEVKNKTARMEGDRRAAFEERRRIVLASAIPEIGGGLRQIGKEIEDERLGSQPIDHEAAGSVYGQAFLDEVVSRASDPSYYRQKILIEVMDMLDPRITDEFFDGIFRGYMNIHDKADLKWDFYTPTYARRFAELGAGVEINAAHMEYLIRYFHFPVERARSFVSSGDMRAGNATFRIPNTLLISIREENSPYPRTATIARIAKNRAGHGIIMPHRIACQPGSDAFEDYRTNAVVCCEIGAALGLDYAFVGPTLEATKQNNFGLTPHGVRHFVYHNPETDPAYAATMSAITLMVMDESHGARLDAKRDIVRAASRARKGMTLQDLYWMRWGTEDPFKTRT